MGILIWPWCDAAKLHFNMAQPDFSLNTILCLDYLIIWSKNLGSPSPRETWLHAYVRIQRGGTEGPDPP